MPETGMVIGTDFSLEMIKTANNNLLSYPNKRVAFTTMNNFDLKFPNELFDLVLAKHTPTDPKQIYCVLKTGGHLIIEGVDRDDCLELKKVFGRGQSYNEKTPISQIDYHNVIEAGFKDIEFYEITNIEYYHTKEDLLALLYKTPIIDDFNGVEDHEIVIHKIDEQILDQYIETHTCNQGIRLDRKLYGIIAKK
jgi:SAM-dependent methyltransferase